MTTIQQTKLTPTTDVTPVVVKIQEKELSGGFWVERFPGSTSLVDLEPGFSTGVRKFIEAMKAAGARVIISATFRPVERAYLMHWSWKIVVKNVRPSSIPPKTGVNIQWDHGDEAKSRKAAIDMVNAFDIQGLDATPALQSRHTQRRAIDMTITWAGNMNIKDASGNNVLINSEPRTGMNSQLHAVGMTYGVIKYWKGAKDKPHWSTDGR